MASGYHLTVKRYLDQNRVDCLVPEYIQRGWNRVYTSEEKTLNKRSCIIGPDVQIPNSTVRDRLGTTQMTKESTLQTLHRAFELPEELFMNLSTDHQRFDTDEEEKLHFQWDDDDDDKQSQRKQSVASILIKKRRQKRLKNEEQKAEYDTIEPLSLDEIIEEIRTNVGKDLKSEDIKLITDLMQVITRHKKEQVMNIYEEMTDIQLISRFGDVPKLVQAVQEIRKAFKQVAMKTSIASFETIINLLVEKDSTYRIAAELLTSFHETTGRNNHQDKVKLIEKFNDISDHDQFVFNILIKDRISRLSTSDLMTLITDLSAIRNIDMNKVSKEHDDQVKFLSEQLNLIFTRAHLDGIKTIFRAMRSSPSAAISEFIEKIENSRRLILTEYDNILIESYIHDHLTSLDDHELRIIYERLAQHGALKRNIGSGQINQAITLGLMNKIYTDGLGATIESMKEIQSDVASINELILKLTRIDQYIQTQSSVSLEQIQKQLEMAYFIQSRDLNQSDIRELSEGVDLYSIAHISLPAEARKEDCVTYLEYLKAPFVRICMQRVMNLVVEGKRQVSNDFYNERVVELLNELIRGSGELNGNVLLRQVKEQLRKNKELPEKLFRQMLKDKFIPMNSKIKVDTDKKKTMIIIDVLNQILLVEKDRGKAEQLLEIMNQMNITLPERIQRWYEAKPSSDLLKSFPARSKKTNGNRKGNLKSPMTPIQSKVKPTVTSTKSGNTRNKDQLPGERKGSVAKRTEMKVKPEKQHTDAVVDHGKIDSTSIAKDEQYPFETDSQISLTPRVEEEQQQQLEYPPVAQMESDAVSKRSEKEVVHSPALHTIVESDEQSKPLQDIPMDDTALNHTQIKSLADSEQTTRDQLNETSGTEEDFVVSDDQSKIEVRQTDQQVIQRGTLSDRQGRTNETLHSDLDRLPAVLFYHPFVSSNPKQEQNIILLGQTPQWINEPPYQKTKAQRALAKPISNERRNTEGDLVGTSLSSSSNPLTVDTDTVSASSKTRTSSIALFATADESSVFPLDNTKSSAKVPRRTLSKSLKHTEDIYIKSLTEALHRLLARSEYDTMKLRRIHEELISSGHISPLNEFFRSSNEALRVILDHCLDFNELIKWTLSLFQTNNKSILIDFGRDLYDIAVHLDQTLIDRIDNTRCAIEIQESLKQELQTISEPDLREINSYLNAAQLEKVVHLSKKLNVTTKERMISDLNGLLLNLIQTCHTFEGNYRPMQTRIREIAEKFKSRAVTDLARQIDEIEKRLVKKFAVTLVGASQRFNDSRFVLIKSTNTS